METLPGGAAGAHADVPCLLMALTALALCSRIIQQLVNGIITPATIPNLGLGPW